MAICYPEFWTIDDIIIAIGSSIGFNLDEIQIFDQMEENSEYGRSIEMPSKAREGYNWNVSFSPFLESEKYIYLTYKKHPSHAFWGISYYFP